jgi:DNA-binding transcriptional LysR family regulator
VRTEVLKSLTSSDAEPLGLLCVGLSHALAEGTLIEPIQALTERYPKLRLRLSSALTGELINRLLAGELDVAAVTLRQNRACASCDEYHRSRPNGDRSRRRRQL